MNCHQLLNVARARESCARSTLKKTTCCIISVIFSLPLDTNQNEVWKCSIKTPAWSVWVLGNGSPGSHPGSQQPFGHPIKILFHIYFLSSYMHMLHVVFIYTLIQAGQEHCLSDVVWRHSWYSSSWIGQHHALPLRINAICYTWHGLSRSGSDALQGCFELDWKIIPPV